MVNIDKHISELLHENDCVIVPKMGGFINPNRPAGIDSSQYSSRKLTMLSFNVLLNHNDGLLANHLVKHEKLTYNEALAEIDKFVDEFNHELNSGKKFIIERVCAIYKDEKRNILIEPFENRNSEVSEPAVVSELVSPPVLQNEIIPEIENFNEPGISSDLPKPSEKFPVIKRNRIMFFSVMLTGSFLAYFLYNYFTHSSELNFASPDSNAKTEQPDEMTGSISESVIPLANSDAPSENSGGSSPVITDEKGSNLPGHSTSSLVAPANMPKGSFYIIAASFRSIDNANRKLDELKSNGFTNAQLFSESSNRHLVSYDRFNKLEEAQEKINDIKMQFKEAWIYSR